MKRRKFPKITIPKITEARLVGFVFSVAPWLTPVITAWLVFNSTHSPDGLGWGAGQSFVAALIIEANGISSTNLLMYLYRERAERLLLIIAAAIVGTYAASVLALTLVLDTFPQAARFAPVLFVFLVLSSNATVAVRAHHRAQKSETRKPRKVAEKVAEPSTNFPKSSKSFTPDIWRKLGEMDVEQIMEYTGRCEKTSVQYHKMARNGHKVAVDTAQ